MRDDEDDRKWKAIRQTGIGASECGAVLGVDPYRTPLALHLEKLGQEPDFSPATLEIVDWGHRLEPVLLMWYADETGHGVISAAELALRLGPAAGKVVELGAKPPPPADPTVRDILDRVEPFAEVAFVDASRVVFRSKRWPWMICTPDALVWDDGELYVLDAKATGGRDPQGWADGGTPPSVEAQLRHSMAVLGLERSAVAVFFGDLRSGHRFFERDAEIEANLVEATRVFWDGLLAGEMPAVEGQPSDEWALRKLYPREVDDLRIVLPPVCDIHAEALHRHRREARKHREAAAVARTRLLGHLRAAEVGETALGAVVRRSTGRDGKVRVVVKRLPDEDDGAGLMFEELPDETGDAGA